MPATFRPKHRLSHARQFEKVYAARLRAKRGPITLSAVPNDLAHPRLGLSIGRRVGNAVARNRFKRLVRESFRLGQFELPSWSGGRFDYVVSLHAHEELALAEYRRLLLELAAELADRRARRDAP